MLAGILSGTDRIGYIADFPIYGSTASINAFALGVKMVNPTALVYLAWSTEKDCDIMKIMTDANVSHISGRDMITPLHSSRRYGLYDLSSNDERILASSIWHWGKFYQRILQTILNGNWKNSLPVTPSINYWWGISSGMIDFIASQSLPKLTLTLVELMRKQIVSGDFKIFSGDLYDQEHVLKNKGSDVLTPEQIIKMDWLLDNIVGHIPSVDQLVDEAVPMVKIQGIYSDRDMI
jgi:basic membrane lipoprotein Med (substrate-binding protein (PBP1-ABC) superfamily)